VRPAAIACALVLLVLTAMTAAQSGNSTRLLRYPAISKDAIAFVYAGDIWIVDINGGAARQLTSHEGQELFPRFSPDGQSIAFTGQYDGRRQVYVMPLSGGTPRQLTYYNDVFGMPPRGGIDNQVLGWTPDGRSVLFNAHRTPWSERISRPHLVPAAGGTEQPLPMREGAGGWLSPDGTRYAYTPVMREFRTWKRYKGGRAQDIWIYDLKGGTAEQITNYEGTDNQPVWLGDTIYFTSDRGAKQKLNLWAYDVRTRQVRQATTHDRYDVLWPSGGPGGVVYENGGRIYRLDPSTGRTAEVSVRIAGDLRRTVPYVKTVKSEIQSMNLSPTARRALIEAHGDVFTAPAKEGEIRNLTSTPAIRETGPSWSPDGQWVAYLSDRTGEYEIYVRPSDGSGDERRVTHDGDVWRFAPVWSPDSRRLLFGDKRQRLRITDAATGKTIDVDKGTYTDLTSYTWSPDSRWVAYVKEAPATKLTAIWVYSVEEGRPHQLTSGNAGDLEPVFDPKGRYLYFLSNRDFNLTFSGYEFNYLYTDSARAYVGLLAKDGPGLLLPRSDEEPRRESEALRGPAPAGQKPAIPPAKPQSERRDAEVPPAAPAPTPREQATTTAATGPDASAPASVRVTIDVEGFEQRVRAIPGAPADHRSLAATDRAVLYLVGQGDRTRLAMYDLEDRRESTILAGIDGYVLSQDAKKVLFSKGSDYGIADVKADQKTNEGLLALDRLTVRVDPRAEWRQQFTDAWRILRDWFYDPGMNGVNWTDVREQYAELMPFVADRSDLDYVLSEIAGELGVGHVYVEAAPGSAMRRVEGALLGADIQPDAGVFKVTKIYAGENWHEAFRSPLTEPGVNVKQGDYILAVDGIPTKGVENFYRLLEAKADRTITLRVNNSASAAGAREERVRPIRSEQNLRYLDWVAANRRHVGEKSGGRIGYIHLPNTSGDGNRELFKWFYPQAAKDALIFDVRYNGGGFIPDRMLEIAARPVLNFWARRGLEPTPTPVFANAGPKVALINGQAGSGGDAFPYYFRKAGLGPLIGTRTWGGLIGLSGNPPLLDGGTVTAPTFRFLSTDGAWDVEGVGIAPDLEVIDRPDLVAKGIDPTLDKGIEVLLQQLSKSPPKQLVVPPAPR
jgi:tricorn protease